MRILLLLCFACTSLALLGCDALVPDKSLAKKPAAKQSTVKKSATNKPVKSFEERRNALTNAQESRFIKVNGEIGQFEWQFSEACERLRDIVNEMFSNVGTVKDSTNSAINALKINMEPEHYERRLELLRSRLRDLRKNLDDAKRGCPDTPSVLEYYRASRELIDGMERLIDERYVPFADTIYNDQLPEADKYAAAEQLRRECYQAADRLHRARLDAKAVYRRDHIAEMNEIKLKKTLDPSFRPTITTIPPPAAAKKPL